MSGPRKPVGMPQEMWEDRNGAHDPSFTPFTPTTTGGASPLAGRVLLAEGMEKGIEPPDELVRDVLLVGRVHWVYAPAGMAKTWLALWMAKQCLERGETVVYLDAENGQRIISERLIALGVPVESIDELLHYYPFPDIRTDPGVVADYMTLLGEVKPALVVFDSLVNFLASAGLEENSNDDLVRWSSAFLRPARERGIACVVLDHVPHEGDHARGASRKRDEADVMWALRSPVLFDRDTVGRITLRRDKDREAWLPERVSFSVGGGEDGFIFRRSDGTIEEPDPEDGLTGTERKVLDVLRDEIGPKGATAAEWRRASAKRPYQVPEASFYRALRTIKNLDLVFHKGEGRNSLYYPKPDPEDGGSKGESHYHDTTPDDSDFDSDLTKKNDSDSPGTDDSDFFPLEKGRTPHYHSLSNHYHDSGDSGQLSSLSPPFKGDSDDSANTEKPTPRGSDPLQAFFGRPPEWACRQARRVHVDPVARLPALCFAVAGHVAAARDEPPAGGVKDYAEQIRPLVAAWVERQREEG